MVFHSFLHYTQLFGRKPTLKTAICHKYFAALDVVYSTRTLKSKVVISGNRICHIDVCTTF